MKFWDASVLLPSLVAESATRAAYALGVVAQARGMADLASGTGLSRAALSLVEVDRRAT